MNTRKFIGRAYGLKQESFVLAIPGYRDTGTGSERAQKQFIGVRSGIGATGVGWLIGQPFMAPVGEYHGHAGC
jgi:hypothetical protein